MKKVLLPLLLLAAFSMLLAVESAPSSVVGYVKYPCVTALGGLNFVALPMDSGWTTIGQLGDAFPDMMDAMSYWDDQNQQWVACFWDGYWVDEFDIVNGMPVMINALSDFNLYSMGALPATMPTWTFSTAIGGLNDISIPLNRSDLSNADLLGTDISDANIDAMSYWDAANQQWVACFWDGYWVDAYDTTIGMPIMVNALNEVTWPGAKNVHTLKAVRASK